MKVHSKRLTLLALSSAAFVGLVACSTPGGVPLDANAVLDKADAAMGTARVNSLRFAATGTGGIYGQAWLPNTTWPKVTYSSFSRVMDYSGAAMREEFARSRAEPNGGGALPLMGEGEQRAIAVLQGDLAWNMVGNNQAASPVAIDARIHDLWTSPHGVLKAAAKNKASARNVSEGGVTYQVLSFSEPGRFTAQAYVNVQGQVDKVLARLPSAVLGESEIITTYSGYKEQSGVLFPSRIQQSQDGSSTLDLQVNEVQLNAPSAIAATDAVKNFAERASSELAAPGVWFIAGGSHNSVLIEMKDHAILVESPLYDGRATAVLAEVQRLLPNKPLRYVVNSHHHFDHAGGLRAAAATGATLIASQAAVPFFNSALANTSSIRPDALTRSGKKGAVEGINGKRVLTDGSRSVELHLMQDSVHASGFVMVYLPNEKLMIEADAYTPAAPNTPPPAKPNGNHLNLIDNIEKLGLKIDRILPLHGRIVPLSELYTAAGKKL